MLNVLRKSFIIDYTISFNSFVYRFKNTKLLRHIFKGDLYNNKSLKIFVRILTAFLSIFRLILFRGIYFAIIIYLLFLLKKIDYFKEVFLLLAVLGMFINTNTLKRSVKKYYNIILLKMDPISYTRASIVYTFCQDLILNTIILLSFSNYLDINSILIALISCLLKVIGEYINILYYKKFNKTIANNNYLVYAISIAIFLIIGIFILLHIKFSLLFLIISTCILLCLAFISYIRIIKEQKIVTFYKRINSESIMVQQEQNILSTRQLAVEISKKDYKIAEKKLKGKTGYKYFNTIFFERHKRILQRSAIYFSIFIMIFFTGLITIILFSNTYDAKISSFILKHLPWLLIIMYFTNRGSIITEAMFINCDHFMLSFNFYREPKVILNLFKERLKVVTKVNLIPAIILGIGLILTLIMSTNSLSILEYILIFITIIFISVFFSVHYLVIYYLLQPYDINLKMRSISYSVISFLTYFICYEITKYEFTPINFSLMIIIATIFYIIIALILVYKRAKYTFRLK